MFCYMEDVLVFPKDQEEHVRHLETVMTMVETSGLRLNKDKSMFRQSEFKFLGHRFTAEEILAGPEKGAAIMDMPAPTTVPLLRQAMGMVHFLGSYVPDLHRVTRPLNDLLKVDTVWLRGLAEEEAFVRMTTFVLSTPILEVHL